MNHNNEQVSYTKTGTTAPNLWLTALALKRPVTTVMIMLSLFLTGLVASRLLPQESWPKVNAPFVLVNVPYGGSTPAEVERLITRPVEEALATMGGITKMRSRSRAGSASIELQMALNADLDDKVLEAREKVDMIAHLLPEDVQRVNVQKFSTGDMPILTLVLSGETDLSTAYDFLNRELIRKIERIHGVAKTELRGVNSPQIEIKLDSTRLAMNRVDQAQLLADLRASNFSVRSPVVMNGHRTFRVSPQGEYKSLADIGNYQVKPGVRLKDVAVVGLKQQVRRSEIRTDRKKSVGLEVFKESDANVIEVSETVVSLIERLKVSEDFKHINISVKNNSGNQIQESLTELLLAGLVGIVLSFFVLLLFFRNHRVTLVVVISVPISLSFALAGMYFLGYSINNLTLAGLFIAVGLLIDNSVVICESIIQQQGKLVSQYQKIMQGVNNVSIAVLSGTLTTVIIFLPMLMGEKTFLTILIENIAVAICLPLLASLVVAKTIIPLMLSRIENKQLAQLTTEGPINQWYRPKLEKVLVSPKLAALIIVVLCGLGLVAKSVVDSNKEFSKAERNLWVIYNIQGGHKFQDVASYVDEMEDYLYKNKDKFYINSVDSRIYSGYASSQLKLKSDIPISEKELKEIIRQGFPVTAIARPSFNWSEQKNDIMEVSITGASTQRLLRLGDEIIPKLKAIDGFAEVGFDDSAERQELMLRINSEQVSRLSLTTQDVASRISTALRGVNLRSLRNKGEGETAIRLVFYPQEAIPLEVIKQLPIIESQGRLVTLQQLVTFDSVNVMQTINREQRETLLNIMINLEDISRKDAMTEIKKVMDAYQFPSGYQWRTGQDYQAEMESMQEMMLNMILAFALIFIVMAALFESLLMPIAILSSILLAFIGVYFTFAITGMAIDDKAQLGMLILMGIVVNNGIVLIDQINKLKCSSQNLIEPILTACTSRVRPILMTVATTIIGLIPVAIASSDNEAYPMAIAIIGGLIFSTFTSLFIVPLCYLMLVKLGERSARRFAIAKRFADKHINVG
ncbi:efflux RND transporter permease subunit [Psychrobium sp. 1_MG-2023]|uniref:efflux RND transporter permease subunit n=1 Tax=Psychrobium sp. 1_MG-2023 TaxID=3062624 RepID=UPI000C337E14|nr:efflux RND transporter permease subunit [Psychrobium sp. 1_MG-2023]MDP2562891.1 efflux RND transporter permease subunit [Psychrobium sp. 1_MG-2023]PKF57625.1 AcrB/AcrD/AcrF family protein [Alteromonadales bacterium alter-6D02]